MGVVAAVVGALAAVGTGVAQGVQAHNASDRAKAEAADQQFKQDQLLRKEKDRQTQAKEELVQGQAKARQDQQRAAASGRASTILTGPSALGTPALGATGGAAPSPYGSGGGKTLLGS